MSSGRDWTDAEMLASILAFGEREGRAPRSKDFTPATELNPGTTTVIERFGTWNGAVRKAGLTPGTGTPIRGMGPDPMGVCGVCFAEILERLLDSWELSHTNSGWKGTPGWNGKASHVWLSNQSGVNQRRIWGLVNLEWITVGLSIADELLTAFERPDLLHGLTVFRRPNGRRVGIAGEHVCHKFAQALPSAWASPTYPSRRQRDRHEANRH